MKFKFDTEYSHNLLYKSTRMFFVQHHKHPFIARWVKASLFRFSKHCWEKTVFLETLMKQHSTLL